MRRRKRMGRVMIKRRRRVRRRRPMRRRSLAEKELG